MPGIWRSIYKLLYIYDWYPEKVEQQDITNKNNMIIELKQLFEQHETYKNKLKFDLVCLQLKMIHSKNKTLQFLIEKNIKLI